MINWIEFIEFSAPEIKRSKIIKQLETDDVKKSPLAVLQYSSNWVVISQYDENNPNPMTWISPDYLSHRTRRLGLWIIYDITSVGSRNLEATRETY
jgi:hypothetical protein